MLLRYNRRKQKIWMFQLWSDQHAGEYGGGRERGGGQPAEGDGGGADGQVRVSDEEPGLRAVFCVWALRGAGQTGGGHPFFHVYAEAECGKA